MSTYQIALVSLQAFPPFLGRVLLVPVQKEFFIDDIDEQIPFRDSWVMSGLYPVS